jgi:hypothetical protein
LRWPSPDPDGSLWVATSKSGDAALLARWRPLVDARPSYGYRRITALLNRQAEAEGLARANHKRVYRVMNRAGLLLAPHTGRGRQRPHDGGGRDARLEPGAGPRTLFEIPCEMHPHRALGMRSPRQFVRAHQPAACPV